MNRTATGWAFAIMQVALLLALVVLPGRDDWSTPAIVHVAGYACLIGGAVLVLVASSHLGPSLTPTPVPVAHGELATAGLYRFMRHPIYTGVLAIVIGLVIRSGSVFALIVGIATALFFVVKARWEEAQLADHYPGYLAYAESTPRFLPAARRAVDHQ